MTFAQHTGGKERNGRRRSLQKKHISVWKPVLLTYYLHFVTYEKIHLLQSTPYTLLSHLLGQMCFLKCITHYPTYFHM